MENKTAQVDEMTLLEKVIFLHNVELLSALSPEQLARIALIARELRVAKETVLIPEGDLSDCLYIIISGKVAVESAGERILDAGEKEVIGTWALLDDEPMIVTAR